MMTREEYLSRSSEDGEVAHRAYYGEIVAALGGPSKIRLPFSVDEIREALKTDKNLNNLRLKSWDAFATRIPGAGALLKERGDYLTLSGGVCILKEAARLLAEAPVTGKAV